MGTRRGETLGILWSDIDSKRMKIKVRSTISKGRRDRECDLFPDVWEDLVEWRQLTDGGPDDRVMPYTGDIRAMYPEWHRIRKAAGIKREVVPHNCRSARATLMAESGASAYMIREQLGHASVRTTEGSYLAPSSDARRAAVAASWKPLAKPAKPEGPAQSVVVSVAGAGASQGGSERTGAYSGPAAVEGGEA
jgi:integrase